MGDILKAKKKECNAAFIECRTQERKVAKEVNDCEKGVTLTTSAAVGAAVAELNQLNEEKAKKEKELEESKATADASTKAADNAKAIAAKITVILGARQRFARAL